MSLQVAIEIWNDLAVDNICLEPYEGAKIWEAFEFKGGGEVLKHRTWVRDGGKQTLFCSVGRQALEQSEQH